MADPEVVPTDGQDVSSASSDASTTVTPDPNQQAAVTTTPVVPGTEAGGEPPPWVRQRLSDATRRTQDAEKRFQQTQSEVDRLNKQISALVGTKVPDAKTSERDELRNLILEAMPEFGSDKTSAAAEEVKELKAALQFLQKQHWTTHATTAVSGMLGRAKEGFKRDLAPEAERILHLAFSSFVQSDEDLTNRFMDGDPTLVDEFYSLVDKGFIQPVTATTTTTRAGQKVAALPKAGGGATLVSGNEINEIPLEERSSKDLMNTAFDVFQRARAQG